MTEGQCPHCGKYFKSLEKHLGAHRKDSLEAETMRRIQEQNKDRNDFLKRNKYI